MSHIKKKKSILNSRTFGGRGEGEGRREIEIIFEDSLMDNKFQQQEVLLTEHLPSAGCATSFNSRNHSKVNSPLHPFFKSHMF